MAKPPGPDTARAAVHSDWARARRLLAVRLDGLGDVLMCTPALAAIRRHHADMQLTLLTSPSGAAAAAQVREIHDCIVHHAVWMKSAEAPVPPEATMALVAQLAERRFD